MKRCSANCVLQRQLCLALDARPFRRPTRECRDRDDHPQCRVGPRGLAQNEVLGEMDSALTAITRSHVTKSAARW